MLDPAAAAELTRFKTPWLLGPIEEFGLKWDDATTRRAAIWLAQHAQEAAAQAHRRGLQRARPAGADRQRAAGRTTSTSKSSETLQATITGWPGGKPDRRRRRLATRAARSSTATPSIFPKRVVVFSPHPDDDVISMGGTFIRLCEQGHEVHVAYQTSGNIAVFDETRAASRRLRRASTPRRSASASEQADADRGADRELRHGARSPARWTAPSCRRSRA